MADLGKLITQHPPKWYLIGPTILFPKPAKLQIYYPGKFFCFLSIYFQNQLKIVKTRAKQTVAREKFRDKNCPRKWAWKIPTILTHEQVVHTKIPQIYLEN